MPTQPEPPSPSHGLYDGMWTDTEWEAMLRKLITDGIVNWREVATTVLGELNPGQVGTGIASASETTFGFKANHQIAYPGQSFMPYVMAWFYSQTGRCIDCGTRLDLQADHVQGRETYENPKDADVLSNMALRCRRHNVAKRESHKAKAGRTELPAQQALMWILFELKPLTLRDFARLCRIYGMTMAGIRFDEAWAMAIWLRNEGRYRIAELDDSYDLICWSDNGVTRRFTSDEPIPEGCRLVATNVPGDSLFCFVAQSAGGQRYYELPIADIPFAYPLGDRPSSDICMWPTQDGGVVLAPRGMTLITNTIRSETQASELILTDGSTIPAPASGRIYFKGTKVLLSRDVGVEAVHAR